MATLSVLNSSVFHTIDPSSSYAMTEHRFGINQDKRKSLGRDEGNLTYGGYERTQLFPGCSFADR
jgi:hypothetical protein